MNRNRTKNFIFYLIKILVILAVVSIVVTVVIPLVSDDYQKITAIATAILAGIALFTYPYARQQLDLMRKDNEANYIKEIFNLEEKMIKAETVTVNLRDKISSLRKIVSHNKEIIDKCIKIADKYEVNLIIYHNRLENLCFYILHFQKSVQNNNLVEKIKRKYHLYFEKIWETEEDFKEEKSSERYPFILELFKDWEIWK